MAPPRRRRASTSSVETEDESKIQWRQEVSVVKTISKSTSFDEWPTFELRDATVFNRDGETIENALCAETKGPFIVRGRLIIDDPSQRTHLIMRVRLSTPIEIRSCVNYSIGESDDGSPLIWLLGKGGWYEISPSRAYTPIYRKMCEATSFYYKLIDIYMDNKQFKRTKKYKPSEWMPELSQIFLKYAARVGDGATFNEVIARCHEHAPFFISQFAQEDPSVMDWKTTSFYKWLITENPHHVKAAEEAKKNPRKLSETPRPQSANPEPRAKASRSATKSSDIEEIDESSFRPSQRLPTQSVVNPPPAQSIASGQPSPAPVSTGASADSIFAQTLAMFEQACEELSKSKKGVAVSALLNKLYFSYKFPNYKDGTTGSHKIPPRELLHYNAQALLDNIDRAKYEKYPVYPWLQELAQTEFTPAAFKLSDFPLAIVPRGSRPRGPRLSGVERPPPVEDSEMHDDSAVSDAPRPQGKGIKTPGRRPAKSNLRLASSKKRPRSDVDSDSESESSGVKKSHYFADGNDMGELSNGHFNGDLSLSGGASPTAEELVQLLLRADKIPSTIPQGPEDAWTCDQDDCDYIVRGGDAEECQERIQEHFNEHEQQMTRVNLAVSESRGLVPINHLLEKIKKFGDQSLQAEQNAVNGIVLPQHIKRKLIA